MYHLLIKGIFILHMEVPPHVTLTCQTAERELFFVAILLFVFCSLFAPNAHVSVSLASEAPEIVNYEPLGLEADMWSIGVITYIL